MSRPLDLMPAASRHRLLRRTVAKRWALAYACVLGTIALAAGLLQVRAAADRAELARLLRQVELDNDQARRIESLRKEHESLALAIERHQRLAWPVSITDIIASIADALPDAAALTSLAVNPVLVRDTSAGAAETLPAASTLTIEISGVAPTDIDVAALIAGLEARPLFDRVAIDHSRSTLVRGVDAREYGVTCQVDLQAKRNPPAPARAANAEPGRSP